MTTEQCLDISKPSDLEFLAAFFFTCAFGLCLNYNDLIN